MPPVEGPAHRPRAKPHLALPVTLDREGGRPLVAQLVETLREAVLSGLLPPVNGSPRPVRSPRTSPSPAR